MVIKSKSLRFLSHLSLLEIYWEVIDKNHMPKNALIYPQIPHWGGQPEVVKSQICSLPYITFIVAFECCESSSGR